MTHTLSALAKELGLAHKGEDAQITGVNTLEAAGPTELCFLADPRHASKLAGCRAGGVVLAQDNAHLVPRALVSASPYLDFVRIMHLFAKPQGEQQGVHPLAFISPGAKLGKDVACHPFAFVGPRAEIGDGSTLFPGVYVGEDCRLGKGCVLYPHVALMAGTVLGAGVTVHAGTVLGADGFGYVPADGAIMKVPQVGHVQVDDRVEIGALSAVDRATLGVTHIGSDTKIDNLVQVGHNVQIGRGCLIVSQTGVSGSSILGDRVTLGGQVGIADHLTIGSGAMVAAKAAVHKNVPEGAMQGGYPAQDASGFRRTIAQIPKLPEMARRIRALEKELERLKNLLPSGEDHG